MAHEPNEFQKFSAPPACIPQSSLTFIQRATLKGLSGLAQTGGVRGLGAGLAGAFSPPNGPGGNVGPGGGGSFQALWMADYIGHAGLYLSANVGPTVGEKGLGWIFGIQYMTSTLNATVMAQDVVNSNISVGAAGADVLGAGIDYSPQTKVITGTIGFGAGGWGGTSSLNLGSVFISVCK